jgi:hypothetical protein
MNAEENQVAAVLWKHYTDEELMQRQAAIAAKVPPRLNNRYAYWMLKGMATHEIITWFGIVRKSAPLHVWDNLKEIAKSALPTNTFHVIELAIGRTHLTVV